MPKIRELHVSSWDGGQLQLIYMCCRGAMLGILIFTPGHYI